MEVLWPQIESGWSFSGIVGTVSPMLNMDRGNIAANVIGGFDNCKQMTISF